MSADSFPAHIRRTQDGTAQIQTVTEHCRHTARYAEEALRLIGLGETAYLAGLLHDLGKTKEEFRSYIENAAAAGERGTKRVNHTFAGVRYVIEHYHDDDEKYLAAELIAYAIGAHHGLFDIAGEDKNGFRYRMEKTGIAYDEAVTSFLRVCATEEELKARCQKAAKEIKKLYEQLDETASENPASGEFEFYLGMTARLLLSAVIEGDRRDTAEFMDFQNTYERDQMTDQTRFWKTLLNRVEEGLSTFPVNSPIAKARMEISDQCRAFADRKTGIYRLSVPTGAGKTLSTLRFALAHAAKHNMRRVIFTAPLISILDQNAAIIQELLQEDSAVLIHHSDLVNEEGYDNADPDGEELPELEKREIFMESWSAPVIITTLVQLLNTLFLGKTSSIRRMQALCNSVIIIDEVQTVPLKLLTMFNLAVRYLSEICGCTFVLCSATQPYLEGADHPIAFDGKVVEEIVPWKAELWNVFARTRLVDAGAMSIEKLSDFAREILRDVQTLLIVCNTKREAQRLFEDLQTGKDIVCFNLSAAMCMAHRRRVLTAMRQAMEAGAATGQKVVCAATQVIEAGVDISFACVIRIAAGMDSIVQAAGRCNRNGEMEGQSPVYVVRIAGEALGQLKEIQAAQTATISLMADYARDPAHYGDDLLSAEAVESYYRRLYREHKQGYQDGALGAGQTLYSLLSMNENWYGKHEDDEFQLGQAFATAGGAFKVFDEETTDVIVPYGEGRELISQMQGAEASYMPGVMKHLLKRAKPYTIALYEGQKQQLLQRGEIYQISDSGIFALADGCYSENMGLAPGREKMDYLEVG